MTTWFFLGNVETDKSRNVAENASSDREREGAEKRGEERGGTVNEERHIAPTNERTDGRTPGAIETTRRPDPFASAVAPKRTRCAPPSSVRDEVLRRGLLFKPLFWCIGYTH